MSKRQEIRVPDIGDFDKVPVIELLVSAGDAIEAEQSLVTLESDKATMEVPSPSAGTLIELSVKEGDEVGEGDVIGIMEVDSEADDADADSQGQASSEGESEAEESQDKESKDEESQDEPSGAAESAGGEDRAREPSADSRDDGGKNSSGFPAIDTGSRQSLAAQQSDEVPAPPVPFESMDTDTSSLPHASPAVRKLARELGVDPAAVTGSGRNGRITESDLKAYVKAQMDSPKAASGGAGGLSVADAPDVDFSRFGEIEEEPLSRIKRISGPNLHRNWVSIPHVTQFDEADITDLEAFRKAHQTRAEAAGTKITPVVFLIQAVVAALKAFPHFNASLSRDGQTLIRKHYFHIGVAVDTPNGLVVPVLRDCDRKGLIELSQELTDLSGRAREGKLKGDEMKGGCLSISSLGGIGGTAFTPIINAPELAILGVSRAQIKPVWDGESFQPRLMLPLSLSYDHRVIDGADAARFTRYLAEQLEDLRRQLL
jgi:pyruvate dehydrogenase E2 component (dihydrolipoamide acetyltransferase)